MTDTDIQAVELPAPDANATPEVQATEPEVKASEAEPSPAADDASETDAKPKGVGKRIDELTRLRRDAERERDHWREMAMRQQAAPVQEVETPQAPSTPKTLADFGYDEGQYQAYLLTEVSRAATEAARKELQAEQARREQEQRKTAFSSRESTFAKTNPDYMEVTRDPSVPITARMAEVIADSEDGPALAYHLAKNVEIADAISRLPDLAQARELGRLEAQLAFERKQADEARKRVSAAPPPTPSIAAMDASANVRTTDASGDALSDEEWVRLERKRTSRRK